MKTSEWSIVRPFFGRAVWLTGLRWVVLIDGDVCTTGWDLVWQSSRSGGRYLLPRLSKLLWFRSSRKSRTDHCCLFHVTFPLGGTAPRHPGNCWRETRTPTISRNTLTRKLHLATCARRFWEVGTFDFSFGTILIMLLT